MLKFSWHRVWALIVKEFMQMRRDSVTIGMLVGIPLIQLLLFGLAINLNPKNLPTMVVSADYSEFTRTFVTAVQNTAYFEVVNNNATEAQAEEALATGKVIFVINIPANFTRDLLQGAQPSILVTSDATDPGSTGNALLAMQVLSTQVFTNLLQHNGLNFLNNSAAPFNLLVHTKYNPEAITKYSIIPGLMGVILTMTMIMITGLTITKERERGTMENLLAMPIRPIEVMIGKILPYIIVGYGQQFLILLTALYLFDVPCQGSISLLMLTTLPFVAVNLAIGLTFSTVAKNQLQAMQMTFFFFLPSILLSGFMFPFYGMPQWAQWLGEVFPLTHFLRIVRGIMLKGNGFPEIWCNLWPILLCLLIVGVLCVKRYRQTLD